MATLAEVSADVRVEAVSDPADNRVLEAAIEGKADYIVTGDHALLELGSYEGIEVVTPARFVAIQAAGGSGLPGS
jgi:predicted nucleic acid-binding protein